MAKLLFIWPQEHYLPSSLFKHYVYLGETAEHARRFGEVKIIDLSVVLKTKTELCDELEKSDFLCIPVEPYTARTSCNLAQLAKKASNATTVAYGTLASMNPKVLSACFDMVISTGHWERAIQKMLINYSAFRESCNGNIYSEAEPLPGLEWPHPPLDLLPVKEYTKLSPGQLEICVQKGCVYNCAFCAEKSLIPENRIYQRHPENTTEFLANNPDFIFYIDATTFTQDRRWAKETCALFAELKPLRKWKTVTRVDQVDENIATIMAEAGCTKIGLGVETLSHKLQQQIRKPLKEEWLRKTAEILKRAGIIPRAFLILGIPGQTADDVHYTQQVVEQLGIEYRWKEYVPFERIPQIKMISEFEQFERGAIAHCPVAGLSREEYCSLVLTKR